MISSSNCTRIVVLTQIKFSPIEPIIIKTTFRRSQHHQIKALPKTFCKILLSMISRLKTTTDIALQRRMLPRKVTFSNELLTQIARSNPAASTVENRPWRLILWLRETKTNQTTETSKRYLTCTIIIIWCRQFAIQKIAVKAITRCFSAKKAPFRSMTIKLVKSLKLSIQWFLVMKCLSRIYFNLDLKTRETLQNRRIKMTLMMRRLQLSKKERKCFQELT